MTEIEAGVVRRAREGKGLTQEGLARVSGTSLRTITRIESGQTRLPRDVESIARALDLSVDDLLKNCTRGRHTNGSASGTS